MNDSKQKEADKMHMDAAFTELRKNFQTNFTRSLQWRKDTLIQLRKIIKDSEKEIIGSLRADMNLGEMNAYLSGVGIPLILIDHVLDKLSDW